MKRFFLTTTFLYLLSGVFNQGWGNEDPNGRQPRQHNSERIQDQDQAPADRYAILVQHICPVSGEKLAADSSPVKIQVGQQHVYLCCQDCLKKQIELAHWNTIQANFAKAQGTCPIMEQDISAESESTVVEGQVIFVCCPPCVPKIAAEPKATLEKISARYTAYVSDRLQIQAQQICPVSGEKLGAKGAPIKTQVGDEVTFLCCQDCVQLQMNEAHWNSIQANLAKSQGVCPVMNLPVDASMESTVISGRRIFVCCPPCIKKIQAEPKLFIHLLNAQIANGGTPVEKSKN